MSGSNSFNLRQRLCLLLVAAIVSACPVLAEALVLHTEKSSDYDLAVSGEITGVTGKETRWLRWADLRTLPTRVIEVDNEFVPGPQNVTVVLLKDLWDKLPLTEKADAVLADCTDGYASVFRLDYIEKWQPFVVLEINGKGPSEWPPKGLDFNPGPYVISVSDKLAPGVSTQLDEDHKRPWGVNAIRFVSYQTHFASTSTGDWAKLSPRAQEGREIWINSCYSCHTGPDATLGGSKAGRPFAVLQTLAAYNRPYFTGYIRAPKNLNPAAKMAAHPHYTDDQIKALIAFVTAEKPKS